MSSDDIPKRTKLFISKPTPGDDAFAFWIAPRLEAAGYEVFADILELDIGDACRTKLTTMLQDKAVKMLLCCSDETL
ncbi:MAG: toll/interleukin-1 receptor domain-containing protein [Paracoccaceae bacterium]|nr:toll/interleukin-1 receptor domain-containing protein [Paracoccaceae bacterium]MDE2914139.1 toll/interleukin-1 receptor domain-containing protein [Paracoccaceae bacterium]